MLVVNLIGIGLIALIIWWFWLYRPGNGVAAAPGQVIEVRVRDGVYEPSLIDAIAGKGISLKFTREDETACAGQVIFPELGIQKELPIGRPVVIRLVPPEPGEYAFHCQMGMYRGILRAHSG
ncbi:cupredoxin domain-containing protein [Mariprofundus erugo]|uniref:Cupredoxin domain-containing protein n=1 Tax=Mariprofundus erugo TaxID=2528639 RepID=A0A5R9GV25_9PROT|nr:cupredoxin domain-containing protein [Mariprofundus erugo]TLS67024.1 cupredoxin domain-containing protein [Mariprofundus erugo]TLS77274.1 cupredoxin domain-containing protein [Mariprofundus erugo]